MFYTTRAEKKIIAALFFFSFFFPFEQRVSLLSLGGGVTGLLRLGNKAQTHAVGTPGLKGKSIVGIELDHGVLAVEREPVAAKPLAKSY